VDVSTILSELNHELVAVGSWINVIADVKIPSAPASTRASSRIASATKSPAAAAASSSTAAAAAAAAARRRQRPSLVQATMLWSAGAVDVKDYETAVRQFQVSLKMRADGSTEDERGK
jgi:hypothetical protein